MLMSSVFKRWSAGVSALIVGRVEKEQTVSAVSNAD